MIVEIVTETKEAEFSKHIDECNNDFKENIMKKVATLKLKDTSELNTKVINFISCFKTNSD